MTEDNVSASLRYQFRYYTCNNERDMIHLLTQNEYIRFSAAISYLCKLNHFKMRLFLETFSLSFS